VNIVDNKGSESKFRYLFIVIPVLLVAILIVATLHMYGRQTVNAASASKMGMAATGPQVVLKVGDKAPAINLLNEKGKSVKLRDLLKKDLTLIAFYPKDFSKICTLEFISFSRDYSKFAGLNVDIVGVSTDSVESHGSFVSRYGMKFDLLSDKDATVSKAYGAYNEQMGRSARAYFLVDKAGIIRFKYVEKSPVNRVDNSFLLKTVKSILATEKKTKGQHA
jgi:thioredoxin-dependent peroxiredoxin